MKSLHLAVSLALMFASACRGTEGPIDPIWGKQPCAHCHMLLSDPTSAAQLLSSAGERSYFDDIGCLVEALLDQRGVVTGAWVRDAAGTWQNAARARYARGHHTPMGYGFVLLANGPLDFAHVQREIAEQRAARSAR